MTSSEAQQRIVQHVKKYIPLSPKEEALFLSLLQYRKLAARQFLVHEQSLCRYENFVASGCLRSYHIDKNGEEHTLHFAIEDWWITDFESFLHGTPSTRNIVALEPCTLLQLSLADLNRLYEEAPIFERFFRLLHQNAALAQDQRIINAISLTGPERYAAFVKKYPALIDRLPQKHIASYLGITPVFLSRIRNNRH